MKRFTLLILILALVFTGCFAEEEVTTEDEKVEVVEKEEPEIEEPDIEEEEIKEEEPKDVELLSAQVNKGERILLDAFVELNPDSLSFIDLPVFQGPENLVNLWTQELDLDFYDDSLGYWDKIIEAQETLDETNDFAMMTVYRVMTSVFEDEEVLTILARSQSVFGYNMDGGYSQLFFIDRLSGDKLESIDQLKARGITLEDAFEILALFQEENSKVSFGALSSEERQGLFEEDPFYQEELASVYGRTGQIILNDFDSAEAKMRSEVFVASFDNEDYLVFEILLASLEENLLDGRFRRDEWVAIPLDYSGGKLEFEEDKTGQIDGFYR
ncbi:MAG: hypothetical protein GX079_07050 [Tissierellia bacterium]|nr:hypothetical protein [Tissierellia bacterium]